MWNPLRPYLGIAVAVALAGFAFYFQYIRDKAQKYDAAVQQLAQARGEFAAWKVQKRQSNEASAGFQKELAGLRAALVARPSPVIRVCPSVPSGPATAAPAPAVEPGSTAGAAAAGDVPAGAGVSESAGADIGPPVRIVFARCEQLSAQLRAILHQGE